MGEGQPPPFASRQCPDQYPSENGTKHDAISPEDTTAPLLQHPWELRDDRLGNIVDGLFQDADNAIGPVDFNLLHTGINFGHILIAFALAAGPEGLVVD